MARLFAELSSATQAAAWIPTEWALLLCASLIAPAWILHRAARAPKRRPRGLYAGVLVVTLLTFKTAWDWNLHRLLLPAQQADLRLAYLNLSAQAPGSWPALDQSADVLVIANRPFNADLEPAWDWVDASEGERDAAIIGRCALMTGLRVRRYAMTHVQFDDVWPQDDSPEPGWAAWVELERDDGTRLVLWVLDLPSPISISRTLTVQRTLDTIQGWRGMATVIDDQLNRTQSRSQGFPAPDIVVGDLNTPRWSNSLHPLKEKLNLKDTSARAGWGSSATFPSPWSFWPIDLCFAHDDWQPVEHRTMVVPSLRHRAITVGLKNRRSE